MVKQTIRIFCRVKPTKTKTAVYCIEEDEHVSKSTVEFAIPKDLADGYVNNKKENFSFGFERVFDQRAKQEDVFDHVAKDVIDNVLSGYNGTIFAYGQTGSGKTFTITGGVEKYTDRGIIPRTLSYLYQKYEEDKDHLHTTEVSYLEIYNEAGYDLLDPRHEITKLEDLPKVALMEDPDQNIHLRNLSVLPAQNEEDALNLLFLGDTNRMVAETPMNQASTRSHCIFTIHVASREPGSATIRRAKLHLVDLAGSERVAKSQVGGQLLAEAKYINLSLHFLEQVIVALSEKKRQHIPYRNSMMTSVLRDSLGGNCMTTMIATISVDKKNLEESLSTCRFAQRVALIKNEATLNEELDPKLLILRLKKEVQSLKAELAMVTGQERSDQLSDDDIEKLQEMLRVYLADDDIEVTLDVGGDMRKIQYCYRRMKHLLNERRTSDEKAGSEEVLEVAQEVSPSELMRLRDILVQRDNEISILVNMLKKERTKAGDSVPSQHASLQEIPRNSARSNTHPPIANGEVMKNTAADKSRLKDQELSAGKQEAYEIFKRDYADLVNIHDQKETLKRRYSEAKELGKEVNDARTEINQHKAELDLVRKQMVISATQEEDRHSFEENEREQEILHRMERAKAKYKASFTRLKAMKAEIDHLHHLLDKARVQMQHDFDKWWQSQARRRAGGSRPSTGQSSRTHNGFNHHQPSTIRPTQAWRTPPVSPATPQFPLSGVREMVEKPPLLDKLPPRNTRDALSDLRSDAARSVAGAHLAPIFDPRPSSSSNIPLTGDKETDDNILAFVKARESMLLRRNQSYT